MGLLGAMLGARQHDVLSCRYLCFSHHNKSCWTPILCARVGGFPRPDLTASLLPLLAFLSPSPFPGPDIRRVDRAPQPDATCLHLDGGLRKCPPLHGLLGHRQEARAPRHSVRTAHRRCRISMFGESSRPFSLPPAGSIRQVEREDHRAPTLTACGWHAPPHQPGAGITGFVCERFPSHFVLADLAQMACVGRWAALRGRGGISLTDAVSSVAGKLDPSTTTIDLEVCASRPPRAPYETAQRACCTALWN